MAEILDENNNSGIDLNSKCEFIEEVRDDVSNASETASGNTGSISTNSFPPEDPERLNEKIEGEDDEDCPSTEVLLQCKVKKLEAEVDSLKSQLSRFSISESRTIGEPTEDRSKQERERCVVFKCIPQAHVANGLMITRVSEFFKIPADELSIQVSLFPSLNLRNLEKENTRKMISKYVYFLFWYLTLICFSLQTYQ